MDGFLQFRSEVGQTKRCVVEVLREVHQRLLNRSTRDVLALFADFGGGDLLITGYTEEVVQDEVTVVALVVVHLVRYRQELQGVSKQYEGRSLSGRPKGGVKEHREGRNKGQKGETRTDEREQARTGAQDPWRTDWQ